ncbi:SH2 domain-containing protein 7 [Brienomyrus brachyistius]|uniref:SH2 domain-containing protein 7 n=1 Tax=Brienomyrus brachyistius TaxID=42636 RepID=UPI0020B2748F|nr:SH2 domain-containing protein 7 [Brienomyrus brachyistius]
MERLSLGENTATGDSVARERALRWFTETQAPLILQEGSFPVWFQGCIARKDAEDRLRDKHLGCFLIRLSDKAVGYILSYKGRDRCRHFVINQTKAGQFLVSGDTERHNNLMDLIEYYRVSPIEPFGEFLTSSCCESSDSDIYDVVQSNQKEKSTVSVQAVRSFWDQQGGLVAGKPPALPPKTARKLTASSSLDKTAPPQAVTPVPRWKSPVYKSPLPDQMMYSSLEETRLQEKAESPLTSKGSFRNSTESWKGHSAPKWEDPYSLTWNFPRAAEAHLTSRQGMVHSELSLSDCRSKSLPILDESAVQCATSCTPQNLSPKPVKKATCHTMSLDATECLREPAPLAQSNSNSMDKLSHGSLYQLAGATQWTQAEVHDAPIRQQEENLYAQVPAEAGHVMPDKLYEQIPDSGLMGVGCTPPSHNNTYETLENIKQKGAKKNDKWRRFFPDHKKH